jgi:tyrosine-protein kinase Etk/Wzc
MNTTINSVNNSLPNEKLDFRDALKTYFAYWRWFALSVIIAFVIASTYLYLASYSYEVSSTILINDNDNAGDTNSDISVFQDLGLFSGPKTSLETEMGVLKSKTLIERVVKELSLNITYYNKTDIKYKELYKDEIPFNINFFMSDLEINNLSQIFFFKAKSETEYALYNEEDRKICEGVFGKRASCEFGEFIITPKDLNPFKQNETILVKIGQIEEVAIAYKRRIKINVDGLNSNLLTLSLKDGIKLKAREVLDSLISYYNEEAIAYKAQMSEDTDEFINNRIDDILVELTSLDQDVESYKVDNKLSNLDSQTNLVLESNASIANQIVELSSQIQLIDYIIDYFKQNKNELIPPNLGLTNEYANQNTIRYNNLILDRNRLLKGANKDNPIILNLNEQIASLRSSIEQNLENTRSSLWFSLNQAKLQENKLDSKIYANPKKQREIRDIERQQEIIETLFLYLLQKREENSISLAVTTPYARIIDKAYGSEIPVSPSKKTVFIIALLSGLMIPFSLIYLKLIFDNKIHNLKTIENSIDAPTLGDIPMSKSNQQIVSLDKKNTHTLESFRLLRTNVSHLLSKTNEKGQTIFITSTIRNEGKTFVSLNLATSFAQLNKRVLLIDADIRNPKSGISIYLKTKQNNGLIEFLTNEELQLEDLIKRDEKTNIDILPKGILTHGNKEFLSNGRFEKILTYGKNNYDYIVVDTSSINSTADTLLLGLFADLFIYIVRSNYLDKKMLEIPNNLHQTNKLNNMVTLLNYSNPKGVHGVGYDYGSDYGKTKYIWSKK